MFECSHCGHQRQKIKFCSVLGGHHDDHEEEFFGYGHAFKPGEVMLDLTPGHCYKHFTAVSYGSNKISLNGRMQEFINSINLYIKLQP